MKPPLSLGLTLSDRYTITQIITQEQGERIYLVEDEQAGSKILLLREFFSENPSAFQEMWGALQTQLAPLVGSHQGHLQKFYETFAQDDRLYVVEEYLDDNANVLFNNGFSEDIITTLLQQMLAALNHIHQLNVYHRNISPNAIFQWANTENFILKDFGVLQNIRSLSGSMRSQKYADQVKDISGILFYSDKDADLYMLAVTMVGLLTGKPLTELFDPYTKKCIWENYKTVSDRLANVLNKMLAVDPIARFPSAAAALEALSGNNQLFPQPVATAIAPVPPIYTPVPATYNDAPYNSYEQSYNSSPDANNWQTQVADPNARSHGNNKWLVGAGVGGGVMLFAIAAVLATRNSQPQVVVTPSPQPTVVVTVTSQPNTEPIQTSIPIATPVSPQNVNLTEDEARQLILNWQNVKPNVFASPFDRQLAAQYTTGQLLQDIVKSNGSIDWLRQNNSYYKYGFRSVGTARFISKDNFQAVIEVRLIEQYTMYRNSKVIESESDYYDKVVRFVLRKEDGNWKISDRKSL
jgi:serine/threonine protein kinase